VTDAAYVFRVTFRLASPAGVRADPEHFETVVERDAEPPGDSGWLFFRDHLWRGAVNDEAFLGQLLAEAFGAAAGTETEAPGTGLVVEAATFSELRTDGAYLDALRDEIRSELDAGAGTFGNADSVEAVLNNHLGSSIHVRGDGDPGSRRDDGDAGRDDTSGA